MGRPYSSILAASAQAGAIDWFEIIAGSTVAADLWGVDIGQTTELGDTQEEQIDYYIKRGSGTYTSGSGGNTGVARGVIQPGDAAATLTAESLNTTRIAVGTGTLVTLVNSTFNVRSGLQFWLPPEFLIGIGPSQALAIGMTAAPADSITWVGTAFVMEKAP